MDLQDTSSFRSKHNAAAINALLAIGRAHAKHPAAGDKSKVSAVATQLDRVLIGTPQSVCIVALCITLLRGLGFARPGEPFNGI